jgi:hypothetical protein
MSNLWQQIKDEVRIQLNEFRPFIAIAGTQSGGRIRIRRVIEATQGTELYARLAGPSITVGDEVICITVGGKPLVLGKLQRSDPGRTPYLLERPIPQLALKALQVSPNSTSAANIGVAAPTLTGTLASADDVDGPWLQHTTGSVSSNTAGAHINFNEIQLRWPLDVEFVIRTPSDITNIRIFVGLVSAFPTVLSPTIHAAAFRFATDSGTDWRAFINDNSGTGTGLATGVTVTADTVYRLRLITASDGTVVWYIDDVGYLSITPPLSNFPAIDTPLGMHVSAQTLTGASRAIKWSRMSMVHTP